MTAVICRRDVLRVIPFGAAALVFGDVGAAMEAAAGRPAFEPNTSIAIAADGSVTLTVRKVEMGQGAHTALRVLVAEELRIPPSDVTVRQSTSDPRYGEILTGGSYTVAGAWSGVRKAAATARVMLERAAAARWRVDPGAVRAVDGGLIGPRPELRATFAEMVRAAAALPVPEEVELTPAAAMRHVGRPGPRCHVADIGAGKAIYGIDVTLPDMLHASLERAPCIGARVAKLDDSAARTLPGYRGAIVMPGNKWPSLDHVRASVAVLADDSWTAQKARELLKVEWDRSAAHRTESRDVSRSMTALLDRPGLPTRREGRGAAALTGRPHEAVFSFPYLAHAPLEPMNAVAWVREGRAEVWTGTQRQRRLHDAIVRELGIPNDRVVVHAPLLGGGFGRRLEIDYGLEAALLSRQAGRPVKVVWTRRDDFRAGLFRSASAHRLAASLDTRGRILAHTHRLVGESVFAQQSPDWLAADGTDWSMVISLKTFGYEVPNLEFEHRAMDPEVPCAWWRGTQATQTQVATECFLDELAQSARQDPLDFRLAHLTPGRKAKFVIADGNEAEFETDRLRRVLEVAAERTEWRRRGSGQPMGIACGFYDSPNTYTAAVARVGGSPDDPRLEALTVVTDCGLVIDPIGAEAQVVSAAIFGLGAALWQKIDFANGEVTAESYGDFRMPLLADVPDIDVVFIPSSADPSGLGEPATSVVMAAVANAVSALRRAPIRNLPLVA